MENRYLFRGKRTDNGEWEIGSLIALPDGKFEIANKCENPPDGDPMWRKCVITHYVDPSTICQCTGMPDKNKKLVFEHDIVWDSDERAFYEIIWNQEDMCWNAKDADDYKSNFEECYGSTIEVNGNSFDNPELLEV